MSEVFNNLTKEEKLQFIQDNFDKMSISKMSKILGHARGTIRNWALELGLSKRRKFTPQEDEVVVKLESPYSNYSITNFGNIFSNDNQYCLTPRDKEGYLRVTLTNDFGETKDVFMHRLIAKAFIPNPENKPYINHKDGVKNNNDIENLEWVTPKENAIHASRTKLLKMGEEHHNSKITEDDVRFIRSELKKGKTQAQIVRESNKKYTRSIVQKIHLNKRWKHVK